MKVPAMKFTVIITAGMIVLAVFMAILTLVELPPDIRFAWLLSNGASIIFSITVTALGAAMLQTPQEPGSKMAKHGRIILITGLVLTVLIIVAAIPGAVMD